MGEKAVSYLCRFQITAQVLYCKTVVFLIQEKSGLLAVFYVYNVVNAVFTDFYLGIEWFSNKAFKALHTFLKADFRIAFAHKCHGLKYRLLPGLSLIYLRSPALSGQSPSARDSTTKTSSNLSMTIPGRKSASPKVFTRQLEISVVAFLYSQAVRTLCSMKSSLTTVSFFAG